MHGLINKSLEVFVRETYGADVWRQIAAQAQVPDGSFESMLSYPDAMTDRTLEVTLRILDKDRTGFLEDLGTFLVSHPSADAVRRLLRFNGATFHEFIDALDDLRDRARLAVPDLEIPLLEVMQEDRNTFRVRCVWHREYALPVILGVLRAMADDYGVLAFFEADEQAADPSLTITLLDKEFSEGRAFHLGGHPA
jgi:hypothetical protein